MKVCQNCDIKYYNDEMFCNKCGAKLTEFSEEHQIISNQQNVMNNNNVDNNYNPNCFNNTYTNCEGNTNSYDNGSVNSIVTNSSSSKGPIVGLCFIIVIIIGLLVIYFNADSVKTFLRIDKFELTNFMTNRSEFLSNIKKSESISPDEGWYYLDDDLSIVSFSNTDDVIMVVANSSHYKIYGHTVGDSIYQVKKELDEDYAFVSNQSSIYVYESTDGSYIFFEQDDNLIKSIGYVNNKYGSKFLEGYLSESWSQ